MSNPLSDLKELVKPKSTKVFIARVIAVSNQKATVQLNNDVQLDVWGNAKIGDKVLIEGSSIVAVIKVDAITTVIVP